MLRRVPRVVQTSYTRKEARRSITSSEREKRTAYDLSPTLRDYPTHLLMPDKKRVSDAASSEKPASDPRKEHSSGFLYTPAPVTGSHVYRDESELRADVRTLIASMVPLNTLRSIGEKLQPRARAKWAKYLAEVERVSVLMENRMVEMLELPASARFERADEVLTTEPLNWKQALESFLRDARKLPDSPFKDDEPLGGDWRIYPDTFREAGGAEEHGLIMDTIERLHHAHWTRAKIIVIPFPDADIEVTREELAEMERSRKTLNIHGAAEYEARTLDTILEDRFTQGARVREILNETGPSISGKAGEMLQKLESSLPASARNTNSQSTIISKEIETPVHEDDESLELAANEAMATLLWVPLTERAISDNREHLVPRIQALQAATFEGGFEATDRAHRILELDPELAAYLRERGLAPDGISETHSMALKGIQDSRAGLERLKRQFPFPTEVPKTELFDPIEEERRREAVQAALDSDAIKEREFDPAEDDEAYKRVKFWRRYDPSQYSKTRLQLDVSAGRIDTQIELITNPENFTGDDDDEDEDVDLGQTPDETGIVSEEGDALFASVQDSLGITRSEDRGVEESTEDHEEENEAVEATGDDEEEEPLELPYQPTLLDEFEEGVLESFVPTAPIPVGDSNVRGRRSYQRDDETFLHSPTAALSGSEPSDLDTAATVESPEGPENEEDEEDDEVAPVSPDPGIVDLALGKDDDLDEGSDEEDPIVPGPLQYNVHRLAVVSFTDRKVWLSEIWLKPDMDEDADDDEIPQGPIVRESVVDIPGDWLRVFKSVTWPQYTLRTFDRILKEHMAATRGNPAIIAALSGRRPLE